MIPVEIHIEEMRMGAQIAPSDDTSSNGRSIAETPSSTIGSRLHRTLRAAIWGFGVGLVSACAILLYSSEIRELAYRLADDTGQDMTYETTLPELEAETRLVERRVGRLRSKMTASLPRTAYLVVSTSDNRFELRGKNGIMREGVCSTGSYVLLRGGNDQEWMFETPRGAFRILDRRVNPVWSKPDWAFVEEGLPVPPPGSPDRYERGVLGKYALAIGNGYLIHGTLYQRMLGQPVTHGCIRLGDDDLETVYRELALGARVLIY